VSGKEPYRMFNLDVFEYELDNPMALYGSIPFLVSQAVGGASAGVFWNNPTETYIDIEKAGGAGSGARWISEAGAFDLTLLPGPGGKAVVAQFTALVGHRGRAVRALWEAGGWRRSSPRSD
jgi:alpha 1,3-glucosidase